MVAEPVCVIVFSALIRLRRHHSRHVKEDRPTSRGKALDAVEALDVQSPSEGLRNGPSFRQMRVARLKFFWTMRFARKSRQS